MIFQGLDPSKQAAEQDSSHHHILTTLSALSTQHSSQQSFENSSASAFSPSGMFQHSRDHQTRELQHSRAFQHSEQFQHSGTLNLKPSLSIYFGIPPGILSNPRLLPPLTRIKRQNRVLMVPSLHRYNILSSRFRSFSVEQPYHFSYSDYLSISTTDSSWSILVKRAHRDS